MSEAIIVTIITALSAVLVAFITKRITNSRSKPQRMDTALDIYEAIVKRQDEENIRLRADIAKLTVDNAKLIAENGQLRSKGKE